MEFYDPNGRWDIPRVVFAVQKQHPELVVEPFAGMNIPGLGWESMKAMAMAGRTGPDIMNVWIHQISTYTDQKLLLPLNEFIGNDTNGNGFIDDSEAKWDYWKKIPPLLRAMATRDGKVYVIPARYRGYNALLIRRDLLRQAGIDPDVVPKSWDEFFYDMQKLTDPNKKVFGAKFHHGRHGMAVHVMPYYWYSWVWAAGGELVMQGKRNPKTGKTHWWPQEAYQFLDPETGGDLHLQPTNWKATFADDAGMKAMHFYWKLAWQPWIKDPETGEPINLTPEQVKAGRVTLAEGRTVPFQKRDVVEGVARIDNGQEPVSRLEMFEKGEVAVIPWAFGEPNVGDAASGFRIKPQDLGFWPTPAMDENHKPFVDAVVMWEGFSTQLAGERNLHKRELAWDIISTLGSEVGQNMQTRYLVEQGLAKYLMPERLKMAGMDEYIGEIPANWKHDWSASVKNWRCEPCCPGWDSVSMLLLTNDVTRFLFTKKDFDYRTALKKAERQANTTVLGKRPESEMQHYRRIAFITLALVLVVVIALGWWLGTLIKQKAVEATGGVKQNVRAWWVPWLLMAPALLSIALWAYYPLLRGTLIAFQDYKLTGDYHWVGLDNFIKVMLDPKFYIYLKKTIKFSAMSMSLTFFAPIILALLLAEIPRLKVFYRTLYFLPQISSSIVIMLLWRQMYSPTPTGLFNQLGAKMNDLPHPAAVALKLLCAALILAALVGPWLIFLNRDAARPLSRCLLAAVGVGALYLFLHSLGPAHDRSLAKGLEAWLKWLGQSFHFQKQDWLGDPKLAMAAVILPGLWAGAGIGSLIYLAALKGVDDELYEAADLDGAHLPHKVRFITLPTILPLITINFVGAFIGTFQSMGNIFVMTGGGPGDETMVLSLAIWYQAFAFLNFSTATAMAWVLGLMLIGFTAFQLRMLQRVEFRRTVTE
ncbi:MAG: extracellular solute-binding protein [Armatimonadetes bacterium]|nr:extracellular solute-binding protein [Armatimonadota bacterium]